MLEPGSCCSCDTLQWQWVVLCKHLARQVLDIYLLQQQWRFAGKRQQDRPPMSISMPRDKQADSVVGRVHPHCLPVLPISAPALRRGDGSAAVCDTCGVYLSQDKKKAIGPAIHPNTEPLFILLSPAQGGSWSGKAASVLCTHDITNTPCYFFSSFISSFFTLVFFSAESWGGRGLPGRVGAGKTGLKK